MKICFYRWATAFFLFSGGASCAQELYVGNPREQPVTRAQGEVMLKLDLTYAYNRIFNPLTGKFDVVRLRSYNNAGLESLPANEAGWAKVAPLDGPTVRVEPGEKLRVDFTNKLPGPRCEMQSHDVPSCFNISNLHTHGFHVSPSGNSDNIFVELQPGDPTFTYEYAIPKDHPAGTFWYHSHRHGSSAIQVSSGMAGALIIGGNRVPTQADPAAADFHPGDIDSLLTAGNGSPLDAMRFPERILLFQQIPYGCGDLTETSQAVDWNCDGKIGTVETFAQFGPATWDASGRFTAINGQVQPFLSLGPRNAAVVDATTGQIERWRLIHAGVRDTIRLSIYKMTRPISELRAIRDPRKQKQWTDINCGGDPISQWEIATDGLTRPQAVRYGVMSVDGRKVILPNNLEPAYRSDILVVFPEAGDYCLIDESAPDDTTATVNNQSKSRRLLGAVAARGLSVSVNDDMIARKLANAVYLNASLADAAAGLDDAARDRLRAIRSRIIQDLNDGLKFSLFVPLKTISETDILPEPRLVNFNITLNPLAFVINNQAYNPERVDQLVKLGTAEEWVLTSGLASHPYHIHVNPFQIVKILKPVTTTKPDGTSVTEMRDVTDPLIPLSQRLNWEALGDGGYDAQYLFLKGAWRDTLFVKQGYEVHIRSRYDDFTGEFVLHCHILDHQDQGMMQNVRVATDGTAEAVNAACAAGQKNVCFGALSTVAHMH